MAEKYQCKHLCGKKLKVFLAVADCIIPPDEEAPGGGTMATAGVVDWALDKMPADLRSKILLFLSVIQYLGFFFGGMPFTKNSETAKIRELKWLENNTLKLFRMGFFGIKTYVCMGYYTREEIWPTFDYDGPILPEREFTDPVIRGLSQGKIEVVA